MTQCQCKLLYLRDVDTASAADDVLADLLDHTFKVATTKQHAAYTNSYI